MTSERRKRRKPEDIIQELQERIERIREREKRKTEEDHGSGSPVLRAFVRAAKMVAHAGYLAEQHGDRELISCLRTMFMPANAYMAAKDINFEYDPAKPPALRGRPPRIKKTKRSE